MKTRLGRRTAALIATGAVALTGAGVAQAGIQNEYTGTFPDEPESGYIGLDVNRVDGKRVIQNVTAGSDMNCRGGGSTTPYTFGGARGSIRVKANGKFEDTKRWTSPYGANADSTIKLAGKVVSRDVVRGTVRIKEVRADGDVIYATCNSGEKRFRATRPQETR